MVDLNKYNNNNIKYSRGKKARKSRYPDVQGVKLYDTHIHTQFTDNSSYLVLVRSLQFVVCLAFASILTAECNANNSFRTNKAALK